MARFDARDLGSWEEGVATLTGSLVHEIKNPLSTLNISAQLLLEEWENPANPRETRTLKRLSVMKSEIARIEKIINSFLRFTRQQILETSSGNLNDLLTDLLDHNQGSGSRSGCWVGFDATRRLSSRSETATSTYAAMSPRTSNALLTCSRPAGSSDARTRRPRGRVGGRLPGTW